MCGGAAVEEDVFLSGVAVEVAEEERPDAQDLLDVLEEALGVVDGGVGKKVGARPTTVQILAG